MTNENIQPVTDAELSTFLSDLNAKRKAHFEVAYPGLYGPGGATPYEDYELLAARVGGKNIKIVTTCIKPNHTGQKAEEGQRYSRSVYCFIDRATGNILKAAGFNAPAKGVRGNIRGDWWQTALTPHGAAYLR